MTILIPYTTKNPQWEHNELRYMLRSIDKNFDFDYKIMIYSDGYLPWLKNVNIKIIDRYYPKGLAEKKYNGKKHYENFFDTLNKLKLASQDSDIDEDIIWIYDDVLLMKKQSENDIKTIYAGDVYSKRKEYWDDLNVNKWRTTVRTSIQIAKQYGEVYIYETHLPRYYKKSNLQIMFKQHNIDMDIPYAPSTLYFNMFYEQPDYIYKNFNIDNQQDNPIKAGFYGGKIAEVDYFPSRTEEQVNKYTQNKLWVNYNEAGMTEHLKNWIQKQFPQKSNYEK
jgi:hypothetical protein